MENRRHDQLSPVRKTFARLAEESKKLAKVLLSADPIMRGTVYELKRKCGKSTCVCLTEGKLHASWVLSRSEEGKTKLRTIPDGKLGEYQRLTECYQDFRKVRIRLVEIQKEMLELVDTIEGKRTAGI